MSDNAATMPASGTIVLPKRLREEEIVAVLGEIRRRGPEASVTLDFGEVEDFDGSTLAFLRHLSACQPGVAAVRVPDALSRAGADRATRPWECWPEKPVPAPSGTFPKRFFSGFATRVLAHVRSVGLFMSMLADEVYHVGIYLKRRRGVYPGETWNQMFFMGYRSYPILCMLLFLVGVTISFASSEPLKTFGAGTYIADIIGYSMLRELVPLMTGVILAGKVGAAITAELASMTVLEEVDALRTMGVVPELFLMVPRLIAITLVVPLLVAMADVCGIFGGIVVARISYGMMPSAFIREMATFVDWTDFGWGLIKAVVFGWAIVVGAGFKGLTVGRSAEEVGRATTESVVLSVTLVIVINCVFAFLLY